MSRENSGGSSLAGRIYTDLRQRIQGGEWGFGTMLPSENMLCAQYGIARGTLRQALARLEDEALLRRERGRGTFITYTALERQAVERPNRTIAFIVPYVRDSHVATILLGIEGVARSSGYAVTFSHVENDLDQQDLAIGQAIQQGVAGVILYPVNSDTVTEAMFALAYTWEKRLNPAHMPLVQVDRYVRRLYTDYVTSDNFGGGLMATRHLLGLGHQKIIFLSWVDPATSVEQRLSGYAHALLEADVYPDPAWQWEIEGYPQIDEQELAKRLTRLQEPAAIFAANDQLALAVQRVARKLKISIPDDLALVGFDDLSISAHLDVPLTTIVQPALEMGKVACELVLGKIKGEISQIEQRILPVRLVVRRSCGALNPLKEG